MKQLTATGVAMVKKEAQPLTPAAAQEDLWENKSSQLIKQIVFSTLYFGITASVLDFAEAVKADSWMLISIPLTTYDENDRYLRLIGKSFNNYQGGLEQHKVQNKDLRTACLSWELVAWLTSSRSTWPTSTFSAILLMISTAPTPNFQSRT